MLTAPLHSTFPKLEGRLLIVVCSYRGGIGNPQPCSVARDVPWLRRIGGLVDRLSLLSLRQFIAANRDFAANPRTLAYQAGLVKDLIDLAAPSSVTISVDCAYEMDAARSALESLGSLSMRHPDDLLRDRTDADLTIVVYPDALGLGWQSLETRLHKGTTYLLNGRRRIQLFDAGVRRRLQWRRFSANTRVAELLASIIVVPVAAVLAAWDAMRGKS